MSSNVLESARKLDADRDQQRKAEEAELLKQARRMKIAVAIETDVPDPSEIIQLVDRLNVSLDWFESGVDNCKRRLKQVADGATVPGLKEQATKLESEAAKLVTECEAAKAAFEHSHLQVKNLGDMTFSPWRNDVTAAELQKRCDTLIKWLELCNDHWLATRDAAAIRDEITKLSKIDQSLIDPASGEEPGRDFKLPPIGN